jgi:hypothetical protein
MELTPLQMLQLKAEFANMRLDANETAFLDRALRHVETKVYEQQYPALLHRKFIPLDTSVPAGAESIWYRQLAEVGKAKLISNYASDLPRVDVTQLEYSIPIAAVGDSFQYSLMDIKRAAMPGAPNLEARRAIAARNVIEWELDDIACVGRPEVGIEGFVNNQHVTVMDVITDAGDTAWAAGVKAPKAIIADLNQLRGQVRTATNSIHTINTILLPTDLDEYIGSTPWSEHSAVTIKQWFQGANPGLTIEAWDKLNNANADGTGGRIIGYFRDPLVLEEKLPMDYTQLPPQPHNLAFVVNAWAITGGTHIYQPKAVVYLDGAS